MVFDPRTSPAGAPQLADDFPCAPSLQILRHYWQGLRQDGALPLRAAVVPRGLGSALDHAFVIQQSATGAARIRVAGRLLCAAMGGAPRDIMLGSLFTPFSRARLMGALDGLFTGAAALHITAAADRTLGQPFLSARITLLPLRAAQGGHHLALGGVAFSGMLGCAPRQFDITCLHSEALDVSAPPIPVPADLHRSAMPKRSRHLQLVHSRG